MSLIQSVLVYSGHHIGDGLKGPYGMSVNKHREMFEAVGRLRERGWSIKSVYGEDLIGELARSHLSETLLVIPAGPASELDVFSDSEIDAVKKSISQGRLRLWTTCGSTYWTAYESIWQDAMTNSGSTIKKRRLGLFPGVTIGPLVPYPGKSYNEAFFHDAISVETKSAKVKVLLSGGGSFFPYRSDFFDGQQKVTTLATYAGEDMLRLGKGPEWNQAVVACTYGLGACLHSMVHPGYGSDDIDPERYAKAFPDRADAWVKIKETLSAPLERESFVADMIEQLESI